MWRSAGFSIHHDPLLFAIASIIAVERAIMVLADLSSEACSAGKSGKPKICLRVLTGGGPPSEVPGCLHSKNLLQENVLQGGAENTARNEPFEAIENMWLKNWSFSRSCLKPPPSCSELSISIT